MRSAIGIVHLMKHVPPLLVIISCALRLAETELCVPASLGSVWGRQAGRQAHKQLYKGASLVI